MNIPPSSLASDLGAILNYDDALSDVTIVVEGRGIKLHKSILGSRCEYFRNMFSSGMSESYASTITLPGVRYRVFLALCEYLYTDQINNCEFAMELLLESEKMSLVRLSALCQRYFNTLLDF